VPSLSDVNGELDRKSIKGGIRPNSSLCYDLMLREFPEEEESRPSVVLWISRGNHHH
jgi:hypothetical protein